MNLAAVLDRLTVRREELGISESALSAQAGSRDLIRNWRRALQAGREIGVRHESVVALAKALQVSPAWLVEGERQRGPVNQAITASGFSDEAAPFAFQSTSPSTGDPNVSWSTLVGTRATTPATYRLALNLPGFALLADDVLLIDLSRLPSPGEIALVTIIDETSADSITLVRRYLPPYLLCGAIDQSAKVLRVDQPGVTVRYPVIGSIRGFGSNSESE